MSATNCNLCGYLHEHCKCQVCDCCSRTLLTQKEKDEFYCADCESHIYGFDFLLFDDDDDLEDGEYELVGFIKIPRDTFSFDWENK